MKIDSFKMIEAMRGSDWNLATDLLLRHFELDYRWQDFELVVWANKKFAQAGRFPQIKIFMSNGTLLSWGHSVGFVKSSSIALTQRRPGEPLGKVVISFIDL